MGAGLGAALGICFVLAGCTSADKLGTNNTNYSRRIAAEGEPIPKGGGNYKIGQPYQINGRTYYPAENPSYRAEGIASWYGPDFHGRATANGEVYDMNGISAAHTTLPIPSYARVTNLENGRSIVVRVNDRGPYVGDRIIDLSIGTAKALDFYSKGLARVRVEYVGRAPLQGSEDQMLLATLRHGKPAPAPSLVMVAAAKSLVPTTNQGRDNAVGRTGASAPADRSYVLSSASSSPAATANAGPVDLRGRPASRDKPAITASARSGQPATPTLSWGPAPAEGSGLMSARGLY